MEISRRSFLKGAVSAAGLAALSALPVRAFAEETAEAEAAGVPSFLTPPEPIDASLISKTLEADVVVVGAGVSGMAAACAAMEGGKKVIVVEKAPHVMCRGNFGCQFGAVDSFVQREHGITIDKGALLNRYTEDTLQMANPYFLKYWIDNSAQTLEWMLEAVDGYVMDSEDRTALPDGIVDLSTVDYSASSTPENRYPQFSTRVNIRCNNTNLNEGGFYPVFYGFQRMIEEAGGEFYFNTFADQLVKTGDAVTGIVCHSVEGEYFQINAANVVLATGDFANDMEMREYYTPQVKDVLCIYNGLDANSKPCNTGDGHKMAIWAGAHMEPGPYAPMAHLSQVNNVLIVNNRGERIGNEDLGAQSITNLILRQPGQKVFVISGNSRGSVVLDPGPFGKKTEETYDDSNMDAMAAYIGEDCDPAVLKATIDRYNELCRAGEDTDYYKDAKHLVELDAPYYATQSGPGSILVIMGGIACDNHGQALNDEDKPIDGLFVVGNVQGGRFGAEYPMTAPAASHGMAITLGRMVGEYVATL
ncbi:MAG: FAD-binding protein [Lachnospiraceae bacterium]|nr:FAD-binding protein [Lachnospiraceae bacterium]